MIDVATKIFDMTVNMGPKSSHIILQKSLNFMGHTIVIDGKFGKGTLRATNVANPKLLLDTLKLGAAIKYHSIVIANQKQEVFLKGWLKRAYA